jgi:exopolysaccharide biosynthesis polyprenyl glycosylphosphotransferase
MKPEEAFPAALSSLDHATRSSSIQNREGFWRDVLLRRMLAVGDLGAALSVAVSIALFDSQLEMAFWAAALAPVWLVLAKLSGLYDGDQRSLRHLTVDELPALSLWALTGVATTALVLLVAPVDSMSAGQAVRSWLIAGSAAFVLRGTGRWLWRRITPPQRTAIVGPKPLAETTRRKLELFPDIHAEVVREQQRLTVADLRPGAAWLRDLDRVIVSADTLDDSLVGHLVAACRRELVKLSVIPPVRGLFGTAVQLDRVADLPLIEYNTWHPSRSTLFLKRVMDVGVALPALLLLAPLAALIALAIRLDGPGPVLFSQARATIGGRPFRMYKFRTMVANAEELLGELVSFEELRDPVFKLREDPRVTRAGRVLRRFSLDEVPQFWNVLRGDMSLVGPRPEQIELVERYVPDDRFRLSVKPGLTGPMQVYGRGHLTFDERLAVEREYIENISLRRDLRIIVLTISAIVTGRGAF